ncbi:sortase domain-bontaining protein [Pseudonocardia sp. WMMC193]|uniref:sortase domain-containing protein n=1 Tax=Pseudonocardia sp. WMMC193 TaxID=2911965 RepID=UPI001F25829B|nr:sortase [Pseudonocardia sp. WMMC193]MCF7547615.1 sortase [Pseudonocardia sp. WMMC193]
MRPVRLLVALGVLLLAGCATAGDTPLPSTPPAQTAPPPAAPTKVTIPALGVTSTLIATGMLPDGTPEVPSVHTPEQASWASWSPEPGEPGPAVLYGHVDGERDGRRGVPGVFHGIRTLTPGAQITVDRDGAPPLWFTVYRVEAYPKADLDDPGATATAAVYGDTDGPELRLVTCGGAFYSGVRSYVDQIVVFARLAG